MNRYHICNLNRKTVGRSTYFMSTLWRSSPHDYKSVSPFVYGPLQVTAVNTAAPPHDTSVLRLQFCLAREQQPGPGPACSRGSDLWTRSKLQGREAGEASERTVQGQICAAFKSEEKKPQDGGCTSSATVRVCTHTQRLSNCTCLAKEGGGAPKGKKRKSHTLTNISQVLYDEQHVLRNLETM